MASIKDMGTDKERERIKIELMDIVRYLHKNEFRESIEGNDYPLREKLAYIEKICGKGKGNHGIKLLRERLVYLYNKAYPDKVYAERIEKEIKYKNFNKSKRLVCLADVEPEEDE